MLFLHIHLSHSLIPAPFPHSVYLYTFFTIEKSRKGRLEDWRKFANLTFPFQSHESTANNTDISNQKVMHELIVLFFFPFFLSFLFCLIFFFIFCCRYCICNTCTLTVAAVTHCFSACIRRIIQYVYNIVYIYIDIFNRKEYKSVPLCACTI